MHARADMLRALNKANLDPEDRAAFASAPRLTGLCGENSPLGTNPTFP
jgi:hypothetical protein